MSDLQHIIDDAFERRDSITPNSVDPIVREAVLQTIDMLDAGQIRVAEKNRRRMGGASMGEEGSFAVLPHQ